MGISQTCTAAVDPMMTAKYTVFEISTVLTRILADRCCPCRLSKNPITQRPKANPLIASWVQSPRVTSKPRIGACARPKRSKVAFKKRRYFASDADVFEVTPESIAAVYGAVRHFIVVLTRPTPHVGEPTASLSERAPK